MKENIISVKELCKNFGKFKAVDRITFDVKRGEIFGFLGANGAGKTTAIRMLCGLSYPTSGSGTVAGFDVMRNGEKIKHHIGYMSQRFSLYDDLTVYENMKLFGGIYGLSKMQVERRSVEILNQLQFKSEINTLVGSLPLGWKQKLRDGLAGGDERLHFRADARVPRYRDDRHAVIGRGVGVDEGLAYGLSIEGHPDDAQAHGVGERA
ncbi:MAG: ABC transporter ATP-binding protein, partial [Bacteroidales bacterium]|nr:ABC transporter ATP-binding protein [Bacteroidales bacterium]